MSFDVVIIGAGIQGLAAAYYTALAGARVAVVEREAPGAGASSAAAGILTPLEETWNLVPLRGLGLLSRNMWPEFAAALQERSGVDPDLVASGTMAMARDAAHAEVLRRRAAEQAAAGERVEWVSPDDAAALLPGLAVPNHGGVYMAQELHLQPPRTVAAATAACAALGVTLLQGQEVRGLILEGQRVTGVQTSAGPIRGGAVVLSGGSWSGLLQVPGIRVPVHPVKGQVLFVQPAGRLAGPWMTRMLPIFLPGVYLVPKRDGRMILGTTEEPEAGFDRTPTLGGMAGIGAAAAAAFPALAGAPVLAHWAGLRPGTADGLPLLGPVPGCDGLIVNTGHFRNGVLLAPACGQAVAAWAAGKEPDLGLDLAPFSPGRFPA